MNPNFLSQIGYALHLPGMGISEPAGTPYSPQRSPTNVGSQTWLGVTNPSQQSIGGYSPTYGPAYSGSQSGQVQGATTQAPSGGAGGGSPPSGNNNNFGSNYGYPQMVSAQQQQEQANIQAAQNEYNLLNQQLEARKGDIQNAYNTGSAGLDAAATATKGAYDFNRSDLQSNYDKAQQTAYQNYMTSQAKNREMGRALGSGTSSGYLDLQGGANNQYGVAGANMQGDLANRQNQLDSNWASAQQYTQQQKAQLANELESGIKQVVLDQNATDFKKADAVAQLRAQAATQMASIDSSLLQFQQQLAMQKQYMQQYSGGFAQTNQGNQFGTFAGQINPYTGASGQTANPTGGQQQPATIGAGFGQNNTNNQNQNNQQLY